MKHLSSIFLAAAPLVAAACIAAPESKAPSLRWDAYPASVQPCLEAMRQFGHPEGANFMGVVEHEAECAISISFPSQNAIDAFIEYRESAGLPSRAFILVRPDGTKQRIPLDLYVSEGTVEH